MKYVALPHQSLLVSLVVQQLKKQQQKQQKKKKKRLRRVEELPPADQRSVLRPNGWPSFIHEPSRTLAGDSPRLPLSLAGC